MFWAFNLYSGDASVSRYGEIEKIFVISFIIVVFGFFLLGAEINLGPINASIIVRFIVPIIVFCVFNRILIRTVQKKLLKSGFGQHKVIIIGNGDNAYSLASSLSKHKQKLYSVIGLVSVGKEFESNQNSLRHLGKINDIKDILVREMVTDIVIALDEMNHASIMELISKINGSPVNIKIVPDLYEVVSGLARTEQIIGTPLIDINFKDGFWARSGFKRVFDFSFSLLLILVLFPIFILIAILIKYDSNGGALFSQIRLGKNGREFLVFKFRSMVNNAEEESGPIWAADNDPRTTRIGYILRKYRLDELPQLLNVLKGEMSLIGPRPERPFFVKKLKKELPMYIRRLRVRPGITGWSQIKHPSDTDIDDVRKKLKYDFFYIENLSFNLDIKILLYTIIVVFSGRGR